MTNFMVRAIRADYIGKSKVRGFRFRNDYVGTYRAVSAVAALSMAGRDPYLSVVMDKKVIHIEAVEGSCEE